MKNSANTLIVTGTLIVLSPIIYTYLSNRLVLQAFIERSEFDKVTFNRILPEYYIPILLVIGVVCIGVGIFFTFRNGFNQRDFGQF